MTTLSPLERLKLLIPRTLGLAYVATVTAAEGLVTLLVSPLNRANARSEKRANELHAATRPYLWRFTCRCEVCGLDDVIAEPTEYALMGLERFMAWHWRCGGKISCVVEGIEER
jgi:hypothetical protein